MSAKVSYVVGMALMKRFMDNCLFREYFNKIGFLGEKVINVDWLILINYQYDW